MSRRNINNNNNNNQQEEDDTEYGIAHIAILQQFIKHGFMTDKVLDAMVNEVNRMHHLRSTPDQYILKINSHISDTSMKILQMKNNTNGRDFTLVNLKSDELSKTASQYPPEVVVYFRNIFQEIIKNKGGIRRSDAFNLSKGIKGLINADLVLQSFIDDGWFRVSESKFLTFSNRTLMDLEPLLRELNNCTLCHAKLLLVKDEYIECKSGCTAVIHNHCARTWFETHKNLCPQCNNKMI